MSVHMLRIAAINAKVFVSKEVSIRNMLVDRGPDHNRDTMFTVRVPEGTGFLHVLQEER